MRQSRIRTVKPELFRHEDLFDAELNEQVPARIAFVGLFTCCDREGRFPWRPRRLKADILPYDDVDMERVLNALLKYGFIIKYEHDGKPYGCIPTWLNHQRINIREAQSECPPPPGFIPREQPIPRPAPAHPSCEQETHPAVTVNEMPACFQAIAALQETLTSALLPERAPEAPLSRVDDVFVQPEPVAAIPLAPANNAVLAAPKPPTERTRTKRAVNQLPMLTTDLERPGAVIEAIFSHWKTALNHPSAKLDDKRKALIAKALKFGYSQEQLCEAITGCSVTPHNLGDNEQGQRYDGLHIILRDSDQIDRFIHNAQNPPRRISKGVRRTQSNVESLRFWAAQKMTEGQS